jgi:FkbM family methyltransferase
MLADVIRKIIPMRARQELVVLAHRILRTRLLIIALYYLLCGVGLRGLKLTPDGNCSVVLQGSKMSMPRDGVLAFIETFHESVYEQAWSPREGDIVVDVGAYVGTFTVKAAQLVGDRGLIIAIEPDPRNAAFLAHNVGTYKLHNVKIIRKAVLDKTAKAQLYLSRASACHSLSYHHKNHIEVEADTLDDIVSQLGVDHVDFLKIDAEGTELEVLRGAEWILNGRDVKLAIAAYHDLPNSQPELSGIVSYLISRGFRTQVYKNQYVYAAKQDYAAIAH